jgi:pilus assembly protein CpaE
MTALAMRDRQTPAPAPQVLALVTDTATETTARLAAAELGLGEIAVEGADLMAAAERMRTRVSPSVLIVDLDGSLIGADADPLDGLNHLAEACDPGVKVVAIGTRNDVGFYRVLLQAGVADYLVKPITATDLVRAIREGSGFGAKATVVELAPRLDSNAKPRRLVAVVGARGGVGATMVAVNLALVLSERTVKMATLLDLDLRFGTAALAFDIEPGSGFKDVLADPTRIDPLLIERASIRVADKLVVLAAEENLGSTLPASAGLVPLIETLTRSGDWVVADMPRDVLLREPDCLAAAAAIVVVTDLSLASLREVLRLKDWVANAVPQAELLVVANGTRPKLEGDLPPVEFARSVAAPLAAQMPFDLKSIAASLRSSKPIVISAPRSPAARAIRAVADRVVGDSAAKRSGVFSRMSFLPKRHKSVSGQSTGSRK